MNTIRAFLEVEAAGTSAPIAEVGDELKAHYAALVNAPLSTVSLAAKLQKANVQVKIDQRVIRVPPSVY